MNILLIGNGFDLAHGLPTRYTDFLAWVKKYQQFYSYATRKRTAGYKETKEPILQYFNHLFYEDKNKPICDEIYKLICDNFWINYFLQNPTYQKENWIDFENEISKVIKSVDADMNGNIEEKVSYEKLSNEYLKACFMTYDDLFERVDGGKDDIPRKNFGELRDALYNDLCRLIRALEIYLCEYVEKIEIQEKSPDINGLVIDFILSFNYTHIFSKLYEVSKQSKQEVVDPFDYIHGEAKVNNTIETNNMVLGIDEYLSKKRRDKETEFIAFKKYYQRIYKQTGCKYKSWVDHIIQGWKDINDEIKSQYSLQIPYNKIPNKFRNQLYVFGHSLDITDRDILRELILKDNVYTTIYYEDKKELGTINEQI